jgi:hypothetical protein
MKSYAQRRPPDGADEAPDEPPTQQEGAGQNHARSAVDALQGGRAKYAQRHDIQHMMVERSCFPLATISGSCSSRLFGINQYLENYVTNSLVENVTNLTN